MYAGLISIVNHIVSKEGNCFRFPSEAGLPNVYTGIMDNGETLKKNVTPKHTVCMLRPERWLHPARRMAWSKEHP